MTKQEEQLRSQNSPLPPSMERAYHKKCIELKRRLNGIEAANDAARKRKMRLARGIKKMRIERAFLLEQLAKSQQQVGDDVESDKSSTAPPTPRDRPPRLKRSYQRRSSPPNDASRSIASPSQGPPPVPVSRVEPSQPIVLEQSDPVPALVRPTVPSQQTPTLVPARELAAGIPPSDLHIGQPVPLIYYLPIGTNVALLPGTTQPKPRPWTIRDLEPRHHVFSGFAGLSGKEQHDLIYVHGYLPYDLFGNPVLCEYQPERRAYRHVFQDDPNYKSPLENDRRTDTPAELGEGKGPVRALSTPDEMKAKKASKKSESSSADGGRRKTEASHGGDDPRGRFASENH